MALIWHYFIPKKLLSPFQPSFLYFWLGTFGKKSGYFAELASKNGVKFYSLVSSAGANYKSIFFYPKIKGQLEESVKKLKFKTTHIFQPPSLIRQDELIRPGEKIAIRIFKGLNYLGVLKSLKPLPVSRLADKMIGEIKNNKKVKFKLYSSLEI